MGQRRGESMAKSAVRLASGEALAVVKHRLAEALGFALLLVCLLLFLSLFTYDPRDGSLNTAVDARPHNFLGQDGAVLADLLWQSLGLACFLIPILLLAWSFRLMLHRPVRSAWTRLALLPAVLTLGTVALSILDLGALSPPAVTTMLMHRLAKLVRTQLRASSNHFWLTPWSDLLGLNIFITASK